jgi:hypothetical protein
VGEHLPSIHSSEACYNNVMEFRIKYIIYPKIRICIWKMIGNVANIEVVFEFDLEGERVIISEIKYFI